MLPPVRPNCRSISSGESTCRAMTDFLKFGAYSESISKHRSANFSFTSSHVAPRRWVGAYCTNIDIKYLPRGVTVGSTVEGMVHSRIGDSEGRPYFASSYAFSM